jgi:hypothetical protein
MEAGRVTSEHVAVTLRRRQQQDSRNFHLRRSIFPAHPRLCGITRALPRLHTALNYQFNQE